MAELLREVINKQTVIDLSQRIKAVYPNFDDQSFIENIANKLKALELSKRIDLVTNQLELFLPDDFSVSANILINSLGEELDDQADDPVSKDYSSNCGFIVISLTNYISRNGQNNFELSMKALYEMTKRFSSENSIRDFIVKNEQETLKVFDLWVNDPNVHVRRLVSESMRPRLPWTRQLTKYISDPTPVLKYLELLKDDKHLYVRRSVANNLNDIAKDHPDLVVKTLKEWQNHASKNIVWLTNHALRTLLKDGHKGALELMGYPEKVDINNLSFSISPKTINIGDSIHLNLSLASDLLEEQKLMIDYIIYHKKANGKKTPKVFKWTKKIISNQKLLQIEKKHLIKKISTRKYYQGEHEIHLQINGNIVAKEKFELNM